MSAEPGNGSANRVRTSDAEREGVAEALRNAVTEGRLSLDEGDERLAALYQTKYRDELPPLLADLPASGGWTAGPDSSATGRGPGRGGQGWAGPGWAGPGPGGSGWGGRGGPGRSGPGWGGPGTGSGTGWGAGFDPRMWRRRRVFRAATFAIIAATLITFFAVTGHFFWPIIPLLIILNVVRFGFWRCGGWHRSAGWHRGWHEQAGWHDQAGEDDRAGWHRGHDERTARAA